MVTELHEGDDPRRVFGRRHKERGPAKFFYTYKDLVEMTELSLGTVRAKVNSDGRVKMLLRVFQLLARTFARRSRVLTEEELRVFFETEKRRAQWEDRWPRFDLYWCGLCGDEVLLAPGLCECCGGARPTVRLWGFHMEVLVGSRYMPLQHFMFPDRQKGLAAHHIDLNPFNNRPANLVLMLMEEHIRAHQFKASSAAS